MVRRGGFVDLAETGGRTVTRRRRPWCRWWSGL